MFRSLWLLAVIIYVAVHIFWITQSNAEVNLIEFRNQSNDTIANNVSSSIIRLTIDEHFPRRLQLDLSPYKARRDAWLCSRCPSGIVCGRPDLSSRILMDGVCVESCDDPACYLSLDVTSQESDRTKRHPLICQTCGSNLCIKASTVPELHPSGEFIESTTSICKLDSDCCGLELSRCANFVSGEGISQNYRSYDHSEKSRCCRIIGVGCRQSSDCCSNLCEQSEGIGYKICMNPHNGPQSMTNHIRPLLINPIHEHPKVDIRSPPIEEVNDHTTQDSHEHEFSKTSTPRTPSIFHPFQSIFNPFSRDYLTATNESQWNQTNLQRQQTPIQHFQNISDVLVTQQSQNGVLNGVRSSNSNRSTTFKNETALLSLIKQMLENKANTTSVKIQQSSTPAPANIFLKQHSIDAQNSFSANLDQIMKLYDMISNVANQLNKTST